MTDPSLAGRGVHYRHMAEATREMAVLTDDPEARANYLDLAARCSRLAEQAAHEARSFRAED